MNLIENALTFLLRELNLALIATFLLVLLLCKARAIITKPIDLEKMSVIKGKKGAKYFLLIVLWALAFSQIKPCLDFLAQSFDLSLLYSPYFYEHFFVDVVYVLVAMWFIGRFDAAIYLVDDVIYRKRRLGAYKELKVSSLHSMHIEYARQRKLFYDQLVVSFKNKAKICLNVASPRVEIAKLHVFVKNQPKTSSAT